jgi:hypothetical protein
MPATVLNLNEIKSESRYVVHGRTGLISEHNTATDAVQLLVMRSEDSELGDAGVYRRDEDCWLLL